jgi:hypothetical protein
MEMTLTLNPSLHWERVVSSHKELKAKVERDREAGSKTIGSIHAAMLKQVATISGKGVSLGPRLPTNARVMQALATNPTMMPARPW